MSVSEEKILKWSWYAHVASVILIIYCVFSIIISGSILGIFFGKPDVVLLIVIYIVYWGTFAINLYAIRTKKEASE